MPEKYLSFIYLTLFLFSLFSLSLSLSLYNIPFSHLFLCVGADGDFVKRDDKD